jgi:hypothetical protein
MNPNFQVYAKILKFALIYRNKNVYEGKQPLWYGCVKHILQNMPSLTNFLTDKTSTFKYKCNKIVKQHYLEFGEYPGTFLFLFVICELIFLIWTTFFSTQNI